MTAFPLVQLSVQTAMSASLASTALQLEGDPAQALRAVGDFLRALGSEMERCADLAMTASIDHPDGVWTIIKIKCHTLPPTLGNVLEFRHHAGDHSLFSLVWRMCKNYLSSGCLPRFFRGQVPPQAPRIHPAPYPDGDVPTLCLDGGGEKR